MKTYLGSMQDFLAFLLSKTYGNRQSVRVCDVESALEKGIADIRFHISDLTSDAIIARFQSNSSELPVFLYRLGNEIYNNTRDEEMLSALHWIMRECCSCEIYFSNHIETGFYVVHGVGTVIGSRNRIGMGFKVYQGCTIGHKQAGENGCVIGSHVTLFANASILGAVTIGDNVIIGSHSLVMDSMPSDVVCYGIPARVHRSLPS